MGGGETEQKMYKITQNMYEFKSLHKIVFWGGGTIINQVANTQKNGVGGTTIRDGRVSMYVPVCVSVGMWISVYVSGSFSVSVYLCGCLYACLSACLPVCMF